MYVGVTYNEAHVDWVSYIGKGNEKYMTVQVVSQKVTLVWL